MEEQKNKFADEIKNLLSNYVEANELNSFISKFEVSCPVKSSTAELINKFYAQQLKIEYNFGRDRMQIDRTITFAQKTLPKEKYLELLKNLAQLCISNGKLSFAFEILNKLLKQSTHIKLNAEAYLLLSDVFTRKANWNKSVEALEKASDLFTNMGNNFGKANCENMLGVIHGEKGNLIESKKHFEICLGLVIEGEEKELAASAEANLGILLNIYGDYDKAADYLKSALKYFESVQNFRRIAELKQNIGMLYFNRKDYEAALHEFDQSIEIALEKKLLPLLALLFLNKANLLLTLDDFDGALAFANKALEVSHLIDDKLSIADVYKTKSIIERKKKNFKRAENYLHSSVKINIGRSNNLNTAEAQMELGELYSEMNQVDKKEEMLKESLREYQRLNIIDQVKRIEEMLEAPSV
jgi:tetratricopeptide (TPR) repeat protein